MATPISGIDFVFVCLVTNCGNKQPTDLTHVTHELSGIGSSVSSSCAFFFMIHVEGEAIFMAFLWHETILVLWQREKNKMVGGNCRCLLTKVHDIAKPKAVGTGCFCLPH